MLTVYICQECEARFTDPGAASRHEERCLRANALAKSIKSSIDGGWQPPSLREIMGWSEGDKRELLRLVEHALGENNADA